MDIQTMDDLKSLLAETSDRLNALEERFKDVEARKEASESTETDPDTEPETESETETETETEPTEEDVTEIEKQLFDGK